MVYKVITIVFFDLKWMLFRYQSFIQPVGAINKLNAQEKEWIDKALKENNIKTDSNDPRIIVVKQDSGEKEKDATANAPKSESGQYNNPYVYAYPPEYYND